jgi:catalase-peroxidase
MDNKIAAATASGSTQQQTQPTEGKCPVVHGTSRRRTNTDWWPNQLNLDILH